MGLSGCLALSPWRPNLEENRGRKNVCVAVGPGRGGAALALGQAAGRRARVPGPPRAPAGGASRFPGAPGLASAVSGARRPGPRSGAPDPPESGPSPPHPPGDGRAEIPRSPRPDPRAGSRRRSPPSRGPGGPPRRAARCGGAAGTSRGARTPRGRGWGRGRGRGQGAGLRFPGAGLRFPGWARRGRGLPAGCRDAVTGLVNPPFPYLTPFHLFPLESIGVRSSRPGAGGGRRPGRNTLWGKAPCPGGGGAAVWGGDAAAAEPRNLNSLGGLHLPGRRSGGRGGEERGLGPCGSQTGLG